MLDPLFFKLHTTNHFRRYIPGFIDCDEPFEIDFNTTEELLANEWIAKWSKSEKFERYSKSVKNYLMAETGGKFWILGYIKHPELVDLPVWQHPSSEKE